MAEVESSDDDTRPQFGNRFLENEEYVFLHNAWYRKKPPLGSRYLVNPNRVFEFNAWDNVEWTEEQLDEAKLKVEHNSVITLPPEEIEKFDKDAAKYWEEFYDDHKHKFFKDRSWLFTEFPELVFSPDVHKEIFEIGCGVGNTIFPISTFLTKNNAMLYGCDLSEQAIDMITCDHRYDENIMTAFVFDVTKEDWETLPFKKGSLDIVILVFVLSAIKPEHYRDLIKKIHEYLKPGGLVLFRDYGRYDLTQLRLKEGRCIGENLYIRGDGTMVYYFTQDEVRDLFKDGFEEVQNHVDRRLQVNRGKMIKMYRVWIQAKYKKI